MNAATAKQSGTINADLSIHRDGTVSLLEIKSRSVSQGVAESALQDVADWRFYPASSRRTPVQVRFPVKFTELAELIRRRSTAQQVKTLEGVRLASFVFYRSRTKHGQPSKKNGNAVRVPATSTVFSKNFWLRGEDLNLRPLGYEPNELPGCSTPHFDTNNPVAMRQMWAHASEPRQLRLKSRFNCQILPPEKLQKVNETPPRMERADCTRYTVLPSGLITGIYPCASRLRTSTTASIFPGIKWVRGSGCRTKIFR